jgi:hypothetical protein
MSTVNVPALSGIYHRETGGCVVSYLMQHGLPSAETPIPRECATWTPLCLRVPRCQSSLRDFADRGSTVPSPCRWKPRMPKLRWFGFMPSVSPTVDGSDQIGGSHFAVFDVHAILALSDPDSPMGDDQ